MLVTVARVHENLFQGEALSLTAPTTEGEVTVLAKHEPFVATLKPGTLRIKTADSTQTFEVTGGVLEVSGNQATVLL